MTFNEHFWHDVLTGIDLDIDWEQASRAADGMISNHGEEALAEAEKRAQTVRSAGCYSAAVVWDIVCKLIRDRSRH